MASLDSRTRRGDYGKADKMRMMMEYKKTKLFSFLWLLLLIPTSGYGGVEPVAALRSTPTQVVIIGTLHGGHRENSRYSSEILRKLIRELKPDAILNELPLCQVDPNGRPLFRDPNYPEGWAADSVAMELGIPQIPFDQPDRQDIFRKTRYFEREKNSTELFYKWRDYILAQDPNSHDAKIVQLCELACQSQSVFDHQAGPEVINSEGYDSVIRMKKHILRNDILPAIFAKYPGYETLVEDLTFFGEHWRQRNRTMADNIIKAAEQHRGKRLVVITGSEHRYILRELLEKTPGIELKEFWEILQAEK